jgi:HEAT repeat protein
MAVALTHFEEPEVVPAMRAALAQETEADVQIFLLWALGTLKAEEAEEQILAFLGDERADLRKMAAYVLGSLGSERSVAPLTLLIEDTVRDVRWNAALSLVRLGSAAGYQELLKMVDRRSLEAAGDLTPETVEEIMTSAVKGITLLGRNDAVSVIEALAEGDVSLKVRQAAIESLKLWRKEKDHE